MVRRARSAINIEHAVFELDKSCNTQVIRALEDYQSCATEEGTLTLMSGSTGVDFSTYGFDEPIRHSRQDA
jgi:hypothetical protein